MQPLYNTLILYRLTVLYSSVIVSICLVFFRIITLSFYTSVAQSSCLVVRVELGWHSKLVASSSGANQKLAISVQR